MGEEDREEGIRRCKAEKSEGRMFAPINAVSKAALFPRFLISRSAGRGGTRPPGPLFVNESRFRSKPKLLAVTHPHFRRRFSFILAQVFSIGVFPSLSPLQSYISLHIFLVSKTGMIHNCSIFAGRNTRWRRL